jgi:hypothetical protein
VALVEPTEEFFPTPPRTESMAGRIFEAVRHHAGMELWPCRLQAHAPSTPETVAPGLIFVPASQDPAGTFSMRGRWEDGATITFDTRLLSDPVSLIATFAHELVHYLLATATTPPPGGEEFEEPATDLGSVFLGFGIFACNAAFTFRQFSEAGWIGWHTSRQGYLGEDALAFALALFLLTHDIDPSMARRHLDPNPRGYLAAALRQLSSAQDEVIALRSLLRSEGADRH